ncbi:MAG: XTP/dITP diphosphatase [Candidatus Bathyarchaeia archaeon]
MITLSIGKNFLYRRLIFFATNNIGKFNEARRILAEYGISVAMIKVKKLEVQDNNIERIAKVSALSVAKRINLPVVVEDAGLFVEALNGFPGPYSSYVYRTIGISGLLKLMEGIENRKAYFKSVVVFCDPQGKLKCFDGIVYGRISREASGGKGFGFDPIFEPREKPTKTFGEMTIDEKDEFSHRSKAFRKFAEWYKEEYIP